MALELTGANTRFTIDNGAARIETLDGPRITIDARDLVAFVKWYVANEPDEIDRLGATIATLTRRTL